jgi:glycerol-3-phosphate acyltransferase PlsY
MNPEIIKFILLFIASYLVGSIPMAYLVVKWRYGTDIRQYGSGGVGSSNIFRCFSKKLGIIVGLYDAGKGTLMVLAARLLDLDLSFQAAVGIAAVIGHNWPVFLRFNAGRGVATTLGVAFFLMPWGIAVFVAVAIFTLLLGSSPLPVLVGVAALPLSSWLRQESPEITLALLSLFVLMVIRRLTAPRTERSRNIPIRELLLNRLLFDRDIRNGKEWIKMRPVTISKFKKQKKG